MNKEIEKLKTILDGSDNIVFFGGAGVSTESGIPDFRSENGLYNAKQNYGYPPETMLSHSFYEAHTDMFFKYYKENLIAKGIQPNAAHKALAELETRGKLKAVITQNIDGLHQAAGSRNVLELHGSTLRNYCEKCGKFFDLDYVMDPANCGTAGGAMNRDAASAGADTDDRDAASAGADTDDRDAMSAGAYTDDRDAGKGLVPYCDDCGGRIKPDVVLYEEALDNDTMVAAVNAIMHAEVLIIGGTSLNVYPAAGLVTYFKGDHLILINRDETTYDHNADLVIHDSIGEVLSQAV